MKNFWTVVLILSCLTLFSSGDVFAKKNESKSDKVRAVSRLNHSGDIKGTIECSDNSDTDGIVVYIPGHSFMVKPGSDGAFTLYNVPRGTYKIVIEKLSQKIYEDSVEVRKKRVTDLETILIDCGDDYDDDCDTDCDD